LGTGTGHRHRAPGRLIETLRVFCLRYPAECKCTMGFVRQQLLARLSKRVVGGVGPPILAPVVVVGHYTVH
jgi:hypothetical protein